MVEIRLPVGKGLAGYVARTGEIVNITNAYQDPRFNPEIDRKSGYTTQTVLCMPMRNREGVIIGVFQLLNKRTGHFGPEDEAFIDALSVHAAIALENARLAQRMVDSERLSAVGRMASSILHDIKNPLATMRLYADIIRRGSQTQDPAQLADQMIRQIDRFNDMAEEILDFAHGRERDLDRKRRTRAGTRSPRPVHRSRPRFAQDRTRPRHPVQRHMPARRGQACPRGLQPDEQRRGCDAGRWDADARARLKHNGYLVIGIGDTGSGIPEEIRSRLFEPFFTHGKRHGTGLGLSIVKKIMDEHRGRVEVDSTIGKGTIFRLFFPL